MSDSAGAAARRRGRRLRAWHRHVKMAVAMELATALHHSAQPAGPVVAGPREVEEQDKYEASRRQKAPPPGAHPGVLKEPEVQLEAATVGYVAASTPLLVVASLAGCDVVDTTTITYLLQYALRKRQKEEEEKRKKEEKEKEEAQRALDDFFSSPWAQDAAARGSQERKEEKRRRKKKKRRKKKLPKGGCRRLCDFQRQVPAVHVVHVLEGAPASIHRQSVGPSCCATETWYPQCELCRSPARFHRYSSWASRCARVVQRQMRGSMVLQTVEVPQLQPIESCRRPFRSAEADPHGLGFSADHRDSQLQYVARWSMHPLCRSFHARRCATTVAHGSDTAENCGGAAGAGPSRLWTSL